MAPNDGQPLSLRPFPVADKDPKNLAEFIARVNAQPGGFRDVTEAKLQDEIKASGHVDAAIIDHDDVDMADAGDDDDAPAKDPAVARMEVLKNVDIASNIAMLTLDSLSLLLSKQNPTTASLTLSQQLREMVGIGTLGADRLDEPNTIEAKTRDLEQVATGWTLLEINKTRDAAEEASALLDREVEIESKYWEDVMAVKKAGWSMCRVPQERHTLGVRFGFSEASPEFKSNGLAAMRRGEDGSVELDLGRLGGVSEGLVVTYRRGDEVVGQSVPKRRSDDNPCLEARVLEARNTIFSQELWHELMREARTLAAYDVRLEGSRLICHIDQATSITMELLALESCPAPNDALPENSAAEAISESLHILLTHAHRFNELIRTRPLPPHVARSRGQQTYALLRPILARIKSLLSIRSCTRLVGSMSKSLRAAGFASSFTLRTAELSVADNGPGGGGANQPSGAQTLVHSMLQPLEFNTDFTILSDTTLTIRSRTITFPVTTTFYHVSLPPSSPLHAVAAPYADGYPDLSGLSDYLHTTIARVAWRHLLADPVSTLRPDQWTLSVAGTSICDVATETVEMRLSVQQQHDYARAALCLNSTVAVDQNPDQRAWRWLSEPDAGGERRPLAGVVAEVVAKSPS
ncbi:hypothetical protein HIM_08088 [Hirsutella minnesotensis 3608]|uniref:Mediator of RNA polymerase II transcription subunit 17 n=1 Tax=Hirsutella minnesotensis 3608 TaxID=1043627 RepID=A0A0F8A3X0_9HYPO|nr:hypothetical protein HIM_08088 [Hirsutella minnesotensis 3608]